MDFGALPPEVNSGRMYVGPGAQSLVTAAESWDSLAGELHAVAASYRSTLADLTAEWRGPSSAAMMSGVAPYVNWVTATAAQAEQTAAQAKAAAAAYENAFIATVPPAAIATNRSQLAVLVATNLFGQNTAAIAANEAHYAEMWAQDAAAMYIYAASSSAASSLTPFKPAPPTTDQGATAVQPLTASAAQASPATSQLLQGLATTAATSAPTQPFFTPAEVYYTLLTSFFNGTIGPLSPVKLFGPFGSFYDLAVQTFLAPFNNFNMQAAYGAALNNLPAAVGGTSGLGAAASAASAEVGQAGVIGGLSVPASWAGPGPALASLASPVAPNSLGAASTGIAVDAQGSIASNMALSGMAGRAMTGVDASAPRTVGGGAGVVAAETTTATIIVIPED